MYECLESSSSWSMHHMYSDFSRLRSQHAASRTRALLTVRSRDITHYSRHSGMEEPLTKRQRTGENS
jgi:hypothetical protein